MILDSGVRLVIGHLIPTEIELCPDWTIRELAMYDFPALVEYVCDATGYDKVGLFFQSRRIYHSHTYRE